MKIKFTKNEVLAYLKKIGFVIIGTIILAFGCAIFVLPFDIVTGGVTGLSIVISNALPEGLVSVDVIIAVLTWAMFFLGLIVLGRDFAMKTLVSTIVYPVGISLFMKLASPEVFGGFFLIESYGSDIAMLIGALFGGVCIGTGCALTFLGGGSTGGTDVIAFVLCKIFKSWKSSIVIFIVDAVTILLGMFVIGNFVVTLLGIISAFVAAIVIDRVFLGQSQAFTAEIVSDKYDELNRKIIEDLHRTSTIIDVRGGYSGSSKKLVSVTFTMRQYAELMSIIRKTDKYAFVSVHRAHEINGEGWTYGEHDI